MKAISANIPVDAPRQLIFEHKEDNTLQTWEQCFGDWDDALQSWFFNDMRNAIPLYPKGEKSYYDPYLKVKNFNIEKVGCEDFGEFWILYSEVIVMEANEEKHHIIVWKKEEAGVCPSPFSHSHADSGYRKLDHSIATPLAVRFYIYQDFLDCADYACWLFEQLQKPDAWKYYFKIIENQLMDEADFVVYKTNLKA
tara:strand:- start:1880 stop:2467 length:588 start_codon:yes stop_codon:yes gene_type:complete